MWQRFTDEARRATFHAQEEAQRLGADIIDIKHLLLALIRTETSAYKILVKLETDIELLRETLSVPEVGGTTPTSGERPLSPRVRRIIDLAFSESRALGQKTIGTEHILLGILAGDIGPTVRTLNDLGVDLGKVKKNLLLIPEPPRNRAATKPEHSYASSALKLVSYQSSAFLALRQGVASADYLALLVLADRPPILCDRLLNLKIPIHEIVTAIEVAIMMGPSSVTPDEPRPADLMTKSGGDVCALFLAIATHASCNTHRAFESMGITPGLLRDALGSQ